jgi:O-methyltransferase involved in polyketide biosynthesis
VSKHSIALGSVQQTLLVPLYCRAAESHACGGLLHDPAAVAIVESLDYDFTTLREDGAACGCVLRSVVLDEWVRRFHDEHHGGTIVEVGAGLSTRCVRLNSSTLHWIAVDLPDVVMLRRALLRDDDRHESVAGTAAADTWVPVVLRRPAPYFLILEGVLVYLDPREVREALQTFARHFGGALIAFDTADRATLMRMSEHPLLRSLNVTPRWACEDPREIQRRDPSFELIASWSLTDATSAVGWRLPRMYGAAAALAKTLHGGSLEGYRCNRFRIW